jgi:hypothetical protein
LGIIDCQYVVDHIGQRLRLNATMNVVCSAQDASNRSRDNVYFTQLILLSANIHLTCLPPTYRASLDAPCPDSAAPGASRPCRLLHRAIPPTCRRSAGNTAVASGLNECDSDRVVCSVFPRDGVDGQGAAESKTRGKDQEGSLTGWSDESCDCTLSIETYQLPHFRIGQDREC